MNDQTQNPIRINHRGFLPKATKRFVLTDNPTGSLAFTVKWIDDVVEKILYRGEMEAVRENGATYYVGNFSSVTQEGDCWIEAGGHRSRQFVIYREAYDICERLLLSFFTYQRCGHPLGWNGACHMDDGFIKETGEHVDLSGGYHQSCDLRKSPGGVSIGVLSMIRAALKDKSDWGAILFNDEIKWACDYFAKTIQDGGAMYNTLNAPLGWGGRDFYRSAAPSSAQWNVTALLALGARAVLPGDGKRHAAYAGAALRSWTYMTGNLRPKEVYRHPEAYPRGMDPDYFYDQCRVGSTADVALQIMAAKALYEMTGDEQFRQAVAACAPCLLDHLLTSDLAHVLVRTDDPTRTVMASCSYTWNAGGLLALCDACELLTEGKEALHTRLDQALEAICALADRSVWYRIPMIYSEGDLSAPTGHPTPDNPNPIRRNSMGTLIPWGEYTWDGASIPCYIRQSECFEPTCACVYGIALARGAQILGKPRFLAYAQAVADTLLGMDEMDSSRIRGIGYNHSQQEAYGQFFPSTPFIPGAVGVGYSKVEHSSEYDMPCVGLAMELLSELTHGAENM